ncbi:MAG: EFR1 family ferrodoxin [Candidatus Omnitrophota bacterium]|nr:EFR1 family ferrodoxin [Candidatus Omnitrophota bacterium]
MDTKLYYFSGTGNSLQVARDLANELGGAEIISIAKIINQQPDLSADAIGIIYPVYMFGVPLIVARFLNKLKPARCKYIFAVATYDEIAGSTLGQTAALLVAQGEKLAAGFLVRMPGNYIPFYGALEEKKQQRMFAKEKQRVKEIAYAVKGRQEAKIEKNNFLFNLIFSGLIYNFASPHIPFLDKDFWADEKCTACGTCVRVCPVKNIAFADKKVRWLHKCEQCFACLHWCPEEAIQYAKKTSGRKRYRHPEIKLEDLLKAQ